MLSPQGLAGVVKVMHGPQSAHLQRMGMLHDWSVIAKGHMQAHYTTLLRLKQYFPFSLIDAMGSLEECRAQIARELRYQSSLDLDEATYAAIRHLPLAKDLVRASRQQLVAHLDGYAKRHKSLFERVRHWQL